MLQITVVLEEGFDDKLQEFVVMEKYDLELEHSLFSLSKWESEFEKPFLTATEKTVEETVAYVREMVLGEIPPEEILQSLSEENFKAINDYIATKRTATWFADDPTAKKSREVITSELIYHWMISLNIPFECQYWHLNRLLTLIRVCNEKNSPPKKMSRSEAALQRRKLNEERRSRLGTSG